ncbi:RF-1 domain-containing protein [Rhodocollybia butyracea]|uniref:RF-1 domain-containing protein n=1 Tax=Rhodocollybia butyracea TaxID=206335 RepID=A0A9P5U9A3_9AGAR|nr:RF-1 domain-containing protein [Rhodocollybia butyracea]
MSISALQKASARSAYRTLYRAATITFNGDTPVLAAFRSKMREDAMSARSETDPLAYGQHSKQALDVARFLRRNVVQASKLPEQDIWSIHLTKDTELGDNDSIKTSSIPPATHAALVREEPLPKRPMYYSALKRASSQRKIPELREEDIEESFVRGSGPGGQSVNKTENNVQLLHKPTGFRVSCQETRSLSTNRMLARRLLVAKACTLDALENPGLSKDELKRAKQRERERRRRKKAKKKMEMKQSESID